MDNIFNGCTINCFLYLSHQQLFWPLKTSLWQEKQSWDSPRYSIPAPAQEFFRCGATVALLKTTKDIGLEEEAWLPGKSTRK